MAQVATIVITPSGSDINIVAEVDSRTDGYNGGKSQFAWEDDVYILVYHDKNAGEITAGATAGTITRVSANDAIEIKEAVQFINTTEASTRVPLEALSEMVWFGGTPSPRVAKAKDGKIILEFAGTGMPPAVGIYVGRYTGIAKADVYKLKLPNKTAANGETDFQIVVWFKADGV